MDWTAYTQLILSALSAFLVFSLGLELYQSFKQSNHLASLAFQASPPQENISIAIPTPTSAFKIPYLWLISQSVLLMILVLSLIEFFHQGFGYYLIESLQHFFWLTLSFWWLLVVLSGKMTQNSRWLLLGLVLAVLYCTFSIWRFGLMSGVLDLGALPTTPLKPPHLSWHQTVAMVCVAMAFLSFLFSVGLIVQHHQLKSRKVSSWFFNLPAQDSFKQLLLISLHISLITLSITLVSGFVISGDLIGQKVAHKAVFACLAWLVMSYALIRYWFFSLSLKALSWLSLMGFILIFIGFFGSKFVLQVLLA